MLEISWLPIVASRYDPGVGYEIYGGDLLHDLTSGCDIGVKDRVLMGSVRVASIT